MKRKKINAEANFLFEKSKELDADICYSVSSKDHFSRIVKYWGEKDREEIEAAVVLSEETYSQSEREPLVVEARVFEQLRNVIAENLDKIEQQQVGNEEIEKVFER